MNILKWKGLDIDPMKISESVTTKPVISQVDTAFNESSNESGVTVLYPRIEAIHEGRTRNFNRYLAEKLKGDPDLRSGVYSWTAPYPKPVIHNHDTTTEATGRVYSASFSEYTTAGRAGIIVTPKITQEKAIKDILEGRLLTVSIGASTNAAICSVCGTDIINEGWCGHMRGEEYDGQSCEWVAGDLFFDELSWVNVPADSDAMITSTGSNQASITASKESVNKLVVTNDDKHKQNNQTENTITLDGGIVSGTIDTNTILTPSSGVVTSVGESKEKEERVVEHEDNVAVTKDPTSSAENNDETTQSQTTDVVEDDQVEQQPETTEDTSDANEKPADAHTQTVQDDVKEQLDKAKEDLKDAQDKVEELSAANQELAKELQESTVNFLVDLRLAIGKESNREEAISKFGDRSLESLRDSISDILAEKPVINKNVSRTVEHVDMPQGEKVVSESKTLATESKGVISNEDALVSLLTGRSR
ncbi:hypothetical protein [Bacillus velezensis]|uniref:hypothetical protein n=1 Tax=Bacillus velezensis TaxID=492670 RepID=UPI001A917674|nr:hypothetical protein [Bacillus velezensis]BCT30285.1 hypothetical protein BVAD3_39590 [Bacillus velezensis]